MNESTFSRFFKRNAGSTFTDHLAKLRIGRACDLLANSGLPVTDICYEVGNSNISNFNRTFRQQRGSTPSAYRHLAAAPYALMHPCCHSGRRCPIAPQTCIRLQMPCIGSARSGRTAW